jgi:integral membrane protein
MFKYSNTPLGRFRLAGISEGISFIVLLFVAMPLKYMGDMPEAVKYVGWAHGLLFVLYILALMTVKFTVDWNFKKTTIAFLASLIPFGTFIMDKSLRKEEKLLQKQRLVSENSI